MRIAKRDSRKISPMLSPKLLHVDVRFDKDALERLKKGYLDSGMDDKWFMFYEDDTLYIHRSWTGFETMRAKVENLDEHTYQITSFLTERHKERNTEERDDYEIKLFKILLKCYFDFTIPNVLYDGLMGLIVGDALGVPVEFMSREELRQKPLSDMIGYGTHNQKAGTWSDDSSMALCLAEELLGNFNLDKIAQSFVRWRYEAHWTPHGRVFDVGIATQKAIDRIKNGKKGITGNLDERSNGNGSLMRIFPLVCEYNLQPSLLKKYKLAEAVSSITHAHIRSCLACFYYLEMVSFWQNNPYADALSSYNHANTNFIDWVDYMKISPSEIAPFNRLLSGKIQDLEESEVHSSGYVIHTLEASVWCLLNSKSYKETVLKAINLGDDTDTTGAVAGSLAGLLYGFEGIPEEWVNQIARQQDIVLLIAKLSDKYHLALL